MFGFNQTSGIEIPESQPQISDSDSVRSAIGQGTNNYTVSQINRYVTAVANRGTVYSLSLIDKTTDSNGKLIKDYTPEVVNQMDEISSSTWDLVHNGMESMVKSSSTFAGMDISMGGKPELPSIVRYMQIMFCLSVMRRQIHLKFQLLSALQMDMHLPMQLKLEEISQKCTSIQNLPMNCFKDMLLL